MSGFQNPDAAVYKQCMIDWGYESDDGSVDLSGSKLVSKEFTVTLAELNTGKTLIAGVDGRVLKPIDFFIKFNGGFTTATDIRLSDTSGSPVDIVTIAIAQATNGAIHTRSKGTNTLGSGFMANLTAGKGIQIRKTGSNAAGGTDIVVQITYRVTA